MSTTPIESRRELFDHFQHTIEGTYDELVDEQELDYGQNMLKSFLVESNIEATELDDRIPVVERREVDFSLDELVIEGSEQNLRFYLDYEDSRFWKLFTLEKSRPAKGLIDDMVGGVKNGLDRTWFPIELQREITELGEFRDIGVKYEADEVFSDEYIEDGWNLETYHYKAPGVVRVGYSTHSKKTMNFVAFSHSLLLASDVR